MANVPISAGTLDVSTIVSQLMTVERQPLDRLTAKETSYQSKLTALGLIKSKIASFQTAAQNLGSSSGGLLVFKATPSDSTLFSATAGSTAVAGAYSIEISKLAQAHKLAAAGQVSDTAAISAGSSTVTFTVGTTSTGITIAAGATLQDIRSAINAANIGVTATIVNDGSATPYRLALSSNSTGLSNKINSITIQLGGDAAVNNLLAYNPTANPPGLITMSETVPAQDANFKVNGISIVKSSNTVTDAINGVTLTLGKQTTAPATLTVERDTAAITDKVSGFVKAYNDLYSAMKNSSAYRSKSALEGDATLRSLQADMRNIASTAVAGGTLTKLSDVGITFDANGTMKLDSAALSSAMGTSMTEVSNLFNSATGYATQFNTWATDALAVNGTIATKTSSINQSILDIGTRKEALERQMKLIEQRYRTQFSSLNVMLSQMSKTSSYISQQLTKTTS